MKKTNLILRIMVLVCTTMIITSCNQLKLEEQEAKDLIIKTLGLPATFNDVISANSYDLGAGRKRQKLIDAGYITRTGGFIYGYTISATDIVRPYILAEPQDKQSITFKAFDIDFDSIKGIAINKDDQTATVRFTLKAVNITPISQLVEENINLPRSGEFVFKKFDKGWLLATEQNKTSIDYVREIWWPNNK